MEVKQALAKNLKIITSLQIILDSSIFQLTCLHISQCM
jgi:hypothetical protein